MNRNFRLYFLLLLTGVLFSNCARYKTTLYFQETFQRDDSIGLQVNHKIPEEIILQIGDNIYINIFGVELGQTESFKKSSAASSGTFNELSLFIQGYLIDHQGNIELPVIGKVHLAGQSLTQARNTLQKIMDEYLIGAVVDVRLLSYEIAVLGEVQRPSTYAFFKKDVHLLEALAKAGDISNYGNAKEVLVIRKTASGSQTALLDLTSTDFMASEYFWLKPGDVIYVKPLRAKMVSINSPTVSVVLSGLTTLLLLLTYISY
jgi:polysaccharide export outer membrane protein